MMVGYHLLTSQGEQPEPEREQCSYRDHNHHQLTNQQIPNFGIH